MSLQTQEYKEIQPQDTVIKIKNILAQVNIFPTEVWMPTPSCGLFSVNLISFDGRKLSSGKGINSEYALASAYSEFMERFQNCSCPYFDINFQDKKILSVDEILKFDNIYTNSTLSKYLNVNEKEPTKEKSTKQFQKIAKIMNKNEFTCIPFYSLKEDKQVYLPNDLLFFFHSTTGMCAGNTPEEALVQGLSEIIERYAGFEIVCSDILPALIPPTEYLKYDNIKNYIKFYNEQGYEVEFRDCSLNKELPVVMMVVFNKKEHTYTTTFGAHPCFRIALQRCFTEFRQEKDELIFKSREMFYKYDLTKTKNDIEADLRRNLLESIVHLNWKKDTEKNKFEYNSEIWSKKFKTNKEMLDYLINIVLKMADNIYIRDVSFLGFCAYYIIVPELSFNILSDNVLKSKLSVALLFDTLYNQKEGENIRQLPKKEIYDCIDYHINTDYLTVDANFLMGVDDCEFGAAYSFVNKDYLKTIEYLEKYIRNDKKNDVRFTKDIASALKLYIEYKILQCEESEIGKKLEKLYTKETLDYINKYWKKTNPLSLCLYIHSRYCEKNSEIKEKLGWISKNVEKIYSDNIPCQINLRKIFVK